MKIWAHRGCSQNYPENTVTAFEKACAISRLAGIETDIQISKDGHLMVFHDERVRPNNRWNWIPAGFYI